MPDFRNGKIYRINVGDEYYIGSTTLTLSQRWANHKQDSNRTSEFYSKVRAHGIQNCEVVLLEEFPCDSRQQLNIKTHATPAARFRSSIRSDNDTNAAFAATTLPRPNGEGGQLHPTACLTSSPQPVPDPFSISPIQAAKSATNAR
jgi:hypothetical protein